MKREKKLFNDYHSMRRVVLSFILFLVVFTASSQTNPTCGTAADTTGDAYRSTLGVQSCAKFLEDFIPSPNDSVLQVRLRFYIFAPTLGSSSAVWTHANDPVTIAQIDRMIDTVNFAFSHIPLPNLTSGYGTTPGYVPDARIKVVRAGVQIIYDDNLYNYPSQADAYYQNYHDINVYLGDCEAYYAYVNNQQVIAHNCMINVNSPIGKFPNAIYIRPQFAQWNPSWDNIGYKGRTMAHEIGHVLGLRHTWENGSYITGKNCCGDVLTTDYPQEPPPPYSYQGVTGSNNMMSSDAADYSYLSPHQIAVLHYHLRTDMSTYLSDHSYTAHISSKAHHNYEVSSSNLGDEVWTVDRYMRGDIKVKTGSKLTIQCKVGMTLGSNIVVERGAQLIIDGGEVTTFNNQMWGGIDVVGSYHHDQSINNSGFATNQGVLRIINGGTISNAMNAVRNYGHFFQYISYGETGGIVIANNANFVNNVRDVEFLSYPNYLSASQFNNCKFKTVSQMVGGYTPYTHVSLWDVKGVEFTSCNFDNAWVFYQHQGVGIGGIDANIQVLSCSFKNMNSGISIWNPDPLLSVTIDDCFFLNNKSGVSLSDVISAEVSRNTFSLIPTSSGQGINLTECKLYTVRNNTLIGKPNSISYGVIATKSEDGKHRIYRNDFQSLRTGILAQGDNSGIYNYQDGLFMNCNTFTTITNTYDIAMVGYQPTVAHKQGMPNSKRVRNVYGASCGALASKWYVHSSSGKPIAHAANSESYTKPLPQPSCSSTLLMISSGPPLDYENDCKEEAERRLNPTCGCRNCCLLQEINETIAEQTEIAIDEESSYIDLIDGGNTSAMLAGLTSASATDEEKKNTLLDNSPYLSDAVLIEYFSSPTIPNTDLIEVHLANAPVSNNVWNTLLSKGLNESTMLTLSDQQSESQFSARDLVEGKMIQAQNNLQSTWGEKLHYYLCDTLEGAGDTVISILALNSGKLPDAKLRLINAYYNAGYPERASEYADSLSLTGEFDEIMPLEMALLQLETSSNKYFTIMEDDALRQVIVAYAADTLKPGCFRARAVLNLVYGTDMRFSIIEPEAISEDRMNVVTAVTDVSKYINEEILVFPNPAAGNFTLLFNSTKKGACRYEVRDVVGKLLLSDTIVPMRESVINSNLADGVYFVSLISSDELIGTKKIVICK